MRQGKGRGGRGVRSMEGSNEVRGMREFGGREPLVIR